MIEQARAFAVEAHGDQQYGDLPYAKHLDDVHAVLLEFGCTAEELQCAAYLHDVLEDTPVTLAELAAAFPPAVVDIVDGLTRPGGISREDDHTQYYPRIAQSPERVCVKLADRIANWRYCLVCGTAKGERAGRMYREEYAGLRALRSPDSEYLCGPLWDELDRLFRIY